MDWSPLGGNPVPGDPGDVRRLAGRFDQVADEVAVQVSRLRGLAEQAGAGIWAGPAADAFRPQLDKLPHLLDKVVVSYRRAAGALSGYAPRLSGAQDKAVHALRMATEAVSEQASARAAARRMLADHGRQAPAAGIVATPYVLAHVDPAVQVANDKLARAHDLGTEAAGDRDRAASACAAELHEASDAGIHSPGGFFRWVSSEIADSVDLVEVGLQAADHLIDAHVGVITAISDWAGRVSTWLGYAALATLPIPGATELIGTVATVAAAVQLLADTTLTAAGDGSWGQVGVDAGGVVAGGAGSVFRDGAGALRAGLDAERAGAAAPVTTARTALARGWRHNVSLRHPAFLTDPAKAVGHPIRYGKGALREFLDWERDGGGIDHLPRTMLKGYGRYVSGGGSLKVAVLRGTGNAIDGGYAAGSGRIPTDAPDRADTPSGRAAGRREAPAPNVSPGACAA